MKKVIIILFLAGIAVTGFSQQKIQPNWQDFTKVINGETGQDKIGMIYVYTNSGAQRDLCTTTEEFILADSTVIKALQKDFICAKFDSETEETIVVKGQKLPLTGQPGDANRIHVCAVMLLEGQMGYPTFAFVDKEGEKLGKHFPVNNAEELLKILTFYSSGSYKKTSYEEWIKKQ